jgi:putative ABC transport system permease protein
MSFAVRATGDPDALTRAARAEVAGLDPTVPVSRIETMERIVSTSVARERFSMVLLGLFAAVALTLAAVGIYGVISYSISRRTAELGIRMAIGASSADVLKMVMVQGTKLAAWGLGSGLVAAAIMSRVMSSQLYGVSAMDPWTFLGVAVILGLVAIVATYLPAHRASRIDPALTIQGEGL